MTEPTIDIEHEETINGGAYRARLPGVDRPAELTWVARGNDVRVANHTFTPPEMRGKGIAAKLVDALVADARAQGFRIDPACPYVADKFAENPEWLPLKA